MNVNLDSNVVVGYDTGKDNSDTSECACVLVSRVLKLTAEKTAAIPTSDAETIKCLGVSLILNKMVAGRGGSDKP